jgi:protein arginine kinase activator
VIFIRRSGGEDGGCDLVLCETCAKERGIMAGKGSLDLNIDDLIGASLDAAPGRVHPAACPYCGLEYDAFRRDGRLGCASCADTFASELERMLAGRPAPDLNVVLPDGGQTREGPIGLGGTADRIEFELKSALQNENYENAALLRDELARLRESDAGIAPLFSPDFPLDSDPVAMAVGPDDDVVLRTEARVHRNIEGLPFPGSPKGNAAPSRSLLLKHLSAMGKWRSLFMSELNASARRSLSEHGTLPRGYSADDEAVLVTYPGKGCYALLDETDHLRIRAVRPGLDPKSALEAALAQVKGLEPAISFASRPQLGWICSRITDCGLGSFLSAMVHLPALAAAGIRDRLFRALMSDGMVIRGFYSTAEESSGALYVIEAEAGLAPSYRGMLEIFCRATGKIVDAERRARSELAMRERDSLVDAEGRAFGILSHCGFLGSEEAVSLLSTLRFAALRGSLRGIDARTLGRSLLAQGSGSVARAAGLKDVPPRARDVDALRARMIKNALADAEYREGEGARCSKD